MRWLGTAARSAQPNSSINATIRLPAADPLPSAACCSTTPPTSCPGTQPSALLTNERSSPRFNEKARTATSASLRAGCGSGNSRSSTRALPFGVLTRPSMDSSSGQRATDRCDHPAGTVPALRGVLQRSYRHQQPRLPTIYRRLFQLLLRTSRRLVWRTPTASATNRCCRNDGHTSGSQVGVAGARRNRQQDPNNPTNFLRRSDLTLRANTRRYY